MQTINVDVAIVGASTAGVASLKAVRAAGLKAVVIDQGPLGTTCARVGCMPSKALLHEAHQRRAAAAYQPQLAEVAISESGAVLERVRAKRDFFAGRTAERIRAFIGDDLVMGRARFVASDRLEVLSDEGSAPIAVSARAFILAVGSRPLVPQAIAALPAERLITTDTLFELAMLPRRLAVLGLGAIGLEMGLAAARLGVEVVGIEAAERIAGLDDPVVAEAARARFAKEFPIHLGEAPTIEATAEGVKITLPRAGATCVADALLVAVGRRSNLDRLDPAQAGISLDGRGVAVGLDPETLQVGKLPIWVAGDANGLHPLLHEATRDGALAGHNAAAFLRGEPAKRRPPRGSMGIIFADPDIVWVGARWADLAGQPAVVVGEARGETNGRSRILGELEAVVRLYAERPGGRLLGATLFAPGAELLAPWLELAIARGLSAKELLAEQSFYHPTISELVETALESVVRALNSGN